MIDVQTNNDKTHILIYPNQSMSSSAYWLMFSLLATVTMIIAIVLAFQGTWVIVPFAALHLLFVWWGFKKAYQNSEIIQFVTISPHQTLFGNSKHGVVNEFQTPWLQVKWVESSKKHASSRLFLKAHNKMSEIGGGIVEEERTKLKNILLRELRSYCEFIR